MSLTGNVDPINEKLLSASEVSKLFKVSYYAVHRWMIHGIQGVQLDAIRSGRLLYTSEDAVRRFVAESSGCQSVPDSYPTLKFKPTNNSKRLSQKEINRQLKAAGF